MPPKTSCRTISVDPKDWGKIDILSNSGPKVVQDTVTEVCSDGARNYVRFTRRYQDGADYSVTFYGQGMERFLEVPPIAKRQVVTSILPKNPPTSADVVKATFNAGGKKPLLLANKQMLGETDERILSFSNTDANQGLARMQRENPQLLHILKYAAELLRVPLETGLAMIEEESHFNILERNTNDCANKGGGYSGGLPQIKACNQDAHNVWQEIWQTRDMAAIDERRQEIMNELESLATITRNNPPDAEEIMTRIAHLEQELHSQTRLLLLAVNAEKIRRAYVIIMKKNPPKMPGTDALADALALFAHMRFIADYMGFDLWQEELISHGKLQTRLQAQGIIIEPNETIKFWMVFRAAYNGGPAFVWSDDRTSFRDRFREIDLTKIQHMGGREYDISEAVPSTYMAKTLSVALNVLEFRRQLRELFNISQSGQSLTAPIATR